MLKKTITTGANLGLLKSEKIKIDCLVFWVGGFFWNHNQRLEVGLGMVR